MFTFTMQAAGINSGQSADAKKQPLNGDTAKELGFYHFITKEFISKAPSPLPTGQAGLPSPSMGEGCNTTPLLRGVDKREGDVSGFTNDYFINSLLSEHINSASVHNNSSEALDSGLYLYTYFLSRSENDSRLAEKNESSDTFKLPAGQDNSIKLKINCKDLKGIIKSDICSQELSALTPSDNSGGFWVLESGLLQVTSAAEDETFAQAVKAADEALAINAGTKDNETIMSQRVAEGDGNDPPLPDKSHQPPFPKREKEGFSFESNLSSVDIRNERGDAADNLFKKDGFSWELENPEITSARQISDNLRNHKAATIDIQFFNKPETEMPDHDFLMQKGAHSASFAPDINVEQHTSIVRSHSSAAPSSDVQNTIDRFDNRVYVAKDSNRLTVTFQQEGIGKLNINLSLENGIIHALINASDDTVRNLIGNNINHIINTLLKDGLSIGDFSVLLEDGRWSGERESQKEESLRFRETALMDTIRSDQVNSNGLINIYI